jgi:2-polyprenyl-6-methoxyphenol hydroxylase-like FAD-dependent oxidoreductase
MIVMAKELNTPVFILGGGPIGLGLALFLNHWNAKCTIVNVGKGPRTFPKGNGENSRTMEHFRQIGLADEIRTLFPSDHNFDQAYFTRFNAWEIFRAPNPCWAERKKMRATMPVDDQYPEPMYHINQMYFEQFLFEKVKAAENVDVWFGWEAIDFEQADDHVKIIARNADDESKTQAWKAQYVADCGGGHSFIRKGLDIHYKGDVQSADQAHWAGTMWNVWLRIPDLERKCVGDRKAWFYWAVNADPDSRSCLIALNGKDEYMLMIKPKSEKGVDAEETKHWVRESIGEDMPIEVVDFASWRAGAALAVERYRTGRIFQLGDAAHLFTPVGSFGMNTGMGDAHNLAWKLAAVLQGWGGEQLLDSYENERRPIGFRNTGAARKYSSRMHDLDCPPHLEEDSPAGEEARKKVVESSYVKYNHFNKPPAVDCTGVQPGARYDDSPVICHDALPPRDRFPETYDVYYPSGIPGGRAPHIVSTPVSQKG